MVVKKTTWYVYMVRASDNALYTGITTDPKRRLLEHQTDKKRQAKFFKGRQAISIVYLDKAENRSAASKVEAQLKKLPKAKKEALVFNYKPSVGLGVSL